MIHVITPAYNALGTLPDTWASLCAQVCEDWRWHVIDDGSTDGTAEWLGALNDRRVQVHGSTGRLGPGAARNRGLDAAGDWVAFLDADDLWAPDKLRNQLAFMRQTGAAFTHHGYRIIRADGSLTGITRHATTVQYRGLLKRPAIGCLTVMVDRSVCPIRFPKDPALAEDTAAWLDALRPGRTAVAIDQVLARYRRRPGSRSANKLQNATRVWRTYRAHGLPLGEATRYWASYASRAAMRTLPLP